MNSPTVLTTHRHPGKYLIGLGILAGVMALCGWLFLMNDATAHATFNGRRGGSMLFLRMFSAPLFLLFGAYFTSLVWHAVRGTPLLRADSQGVQVFDPIAGPVEIKWSEISEILFTEIPVGKKTVPGFYIVQNKPKKTGLLFTSRNTNPIIVNPSGMKESCSEIQKWFEAHSIAATKIKTISRAA